MTKKKVFVVALAVCLLAILSMSSLAWFSAKDSVKNEFYVADSTVTDPDDVFSVDVYEYTENSPTNKVPAGETYKDILPGDLLKKEPHVANTGYYDQYIRVIITMSDAANWKAILGNEFGEAAILGLFDGLDQTMWNHITVETLDASDEIRIVMYYNGILDGTDAGDETADITVFNNVKIPSTMDQEDAVNFGADGFTIDVKAQAVQTENVVPDGTAAEDAAWAAFDTVKMALDA